MSAWQSTRHGTSFNDAESFWEEQALIENGQDALLKYGISWFDTFCLNAEVLAAWLEKAIEERISVGDLVDPPQNAHPEIEALIAPYVKNHTRSAPMLYELFLSLLRLDQGQHKAACRHAQTYLQSLRQSGARFSTEPERTLRQLQKMGCNRAGDPVQSVP